MAAIYETTMSLRFFGDDLDPDEITSRMGSQPSIGRRKDEVWLTSKGVERIAHTGSWLLKASVSRPGDLDRQVAELLGSLCDDLSTWHDLTARFKVDVFCGLFMQEGNEGISLSAKTMEKLSSRHLSIGFDIYDPGDPDCGPAEAGLDGRSVGGKGQGR